MNKTLVTASSVINSGYTKLYGFSVKTENNVSIKIRNGGSSDEVVYFADVEADSSIQESLKNPIILHDGLYFETSATIEGAVWWAGYEDVDGSVQYPIRDNTRGATDAP